MGQTKGKGRQRNEQTHRANKRAREETSGLIDPRLRKALSHELRVQILTVANLREVSPSEFSDELDVPLSNVSYHFRKLLEYDCIELTREVPVRGSHEHRYVGTRRGLIGDGDWAQLGKGTQAGVRIAGFQDLINRCTQAVEGETFDARDDATFYWVPMGLDEIGWKKMQAAIRRIISEVGQFEVESTQRVAEGESQSVPATFGVLGFESPTKPNWNRRRHTKAGEAKSKGRAKAPKK